MCYRFCAIVSMVRGVYSGYNALFGKAGGVIYLAPSFPLAVQTAGEMYEINCDSRFTIIILYFCEKLKRYAPYRRVAEHYRKYPLKKMRAVL